MLDFFWLHMLLLPPHPWEKDEGRWRYCQGAVHLWGFCYFICGLGVVIVLNIFRMSSPKRLHYILSQAWQAWMLGGPRCWFQCHIFSTIYKLLSTARKHTTALHSDLPRGGQPGASWGMSTTPQWAQVAGSLLWESGGATISLCLRHNGLF